MDESKEPEDKQQEPGDVPQWMVWVSDEIKGSESRQARLLHSEIGAVRTEIRATEGRLVLKHAIITSLVGAFMTLFLTLAMAFYSRQPVPAVAPVPAEASAPAPREAPPPEAAASPAVVMAARAEPATLPVPSATISATEPRPTTSPSTQAATAPATQEAAR